ncbi:hypothetical protein BCR33DRAFT_714575 [Rhizoclosmatium globosum]|uniref:N-acetyltransferase domain-containing protein n=1 Tax=Rhizoclosmatium globosum TaxID=329046 RepID=A0A1Y2CMK1_9FUNG|nr:hypothetical protein HDU79_006279 [Rhizoclosmatium sp. JEL0117]ORY48156.1 hypothetical protein BCR33DRAFT_714575 [Rhizoclosmatium globosum]|eukprot:ORY48156.1 hypothetical protein BCR33DRAFT_714575 [Rhizoclosmatium globosum]
MPATTFSTAHNIHSLSSEKEKDVAIQSLVTAFHNDPIAQFAFPDEYIRDLNHTHLFTDIIKDQRSENVIIDVTEGAEAVAIWERKNPGDVSSGGDKGSCPVPPHVQEFFDKVEAAEPPRPYLYLSFLGSAKKGTGAGSALIRHRLKQLRKGERVALWTGNESNVKFYEKFGFRLFAKIQGNGVAAFWMVRV